MTCAVPAWPFGPRSHRIHWPDSEPAPLERGGFVLLEGSMELIANAGGSLCSSRWQGLVVHMPLPLFQQRWMAAAQCQIHALESWEKTPWGACCDPDKTHAAKRKNPAYVH